MAVRLTCLLFFSIGVVGWYRVIRLLELSPVTVWAVAVLTALYALTMGGASRIVAPDVIAFGVGSWLIAGVLRHTLCYERGETAKPGLWLALGLGSVYWLKYSAFVAASGLLACLLVNVLVEGNRPLRSRALRTLALLLTFLLPIVALTMINLQLGGALNTVTQAGSSFSLESFRNGWLLLSLAGAPGSSLFHADHITDHLAYFAHVPWRAIMSLQESQPERIKAALSIPGTLFIIWGLVRTRRVLGPAVVRFAVLSAGIPFLVMLALTWRMGVNLLAVCDRYVALFFLLPDAIVLEAAVRRYQTGSRPTRAILACLLVVLLVLPIAFVAAVYVRQDFAGLTDTVRTKHGLQAPMLSRIDAEEVAGAVRGALTSPLDIVVLAVPDGSGSSFVPWLLFPERSIPLGYFFGPLANGYGDAADLRGTTLFLTSRPLRVVLVVNSAFTASGRLQSLQRRFPQAGPWRRVPAPQHAGVDLVAAELMPRRSTN
jgi:hypothetical protein